MMEQERYIKFLELLAITLELLTFNKMLKFKSVHIQVDNLAALIYFLITEYLFKHQIIIIADYLLELLIC